MCCLAHSKGPNSIMSWFEKWQKKSGLKMAAPVQSLFQDFFLGVLYIKKIVPSTFFVCVWKTFVPISQISTYLGSRGLPFFGLGVFFLSVCKRCFIRIHVQNLYDFWLLIYLWLVILYLLWQSLVIVTGCHWGFNFQTSNAICRRFWADGTIFLSCCLLLCTNPPLIIFHCPLSSHPKDSSTTIQLSTDCT